MISNPSGPDTGTKALGANATQFLVGAVAALALLYFLRAILIPFFAALLLIALIEGLVRALARTWPSGPRWALIVGAGAIIIALLAGCGAVLAYGVQRIVADAPLILSRLDAVIAQLSERAGLTTAPRLEAMIGADQLMALASPLVSGLGGFSGSVTLAALFMVFMLASRALLIRKIEIVAHSTERSSAFKRVAARIASSAGDYMWVQTVTGAIVGGGCGIALYVIGLHNAAFWAVLIFLLAYVPVVGVTIGTVAATLFALVQFPTYWQAVAIFLSTQVIASLVGNLLLPKMQADKQNLDPTVSIFAVALWSLLWGIPGALLAIPLTVMLMIIFNQFEQTRWAAVLISNDGVPEGDAPRSPRSPSAGA